MEFYGVRYPKGAKIVNEETKENHEEEERGKVLQDKVEAMKLAKSVKGSRFKFFQSREKAEEFINAEETEDLSSKPSSSEGEPCPFPSLMAQQLKAIKEAIMARDETKFHALVDSNPRYLVTTYDTPAIVHSGTRANALITAVTSQSLKMVTMVLNKIQDPTLFAKMYPSETEEARAKRMEHLLDLFLNMPNRGHYDTPLHTAAKFGHLDIVRLLVGFSSCNTRALNKAGSTPAEVVCTRMGDYDADVEKEIKKALEGQVYIPVIRDYDLLTPGHLGETLHQGDEVVAQCIGRNNLLIHSPMPAWNNTPARSPSRGSPRRLTPAGSPIALSPLSPANMRVSSGLSSVQALLGPLSPQEASRVRSEWKANTPRALRLTDPAKGLERQGRKVARSLNTSQFEYWEFLDAYCDLSSAEGLQLLDNHLYDIARKMSEERQREVEDSDDEGDVRNGNVPNENVMSPMSQLARDLGELRLSSPPNGQRNDLQDEDNGNFGAGAESDSDGSFLSFPRDRTTSESSFETADEGASVYMKGARPTLADAQVLDALQDSGVTLECVRPYPSVAAWMAAVASAGDDERKRWGKFTSAAARRELSSVPKLRFEGFEESL